MGIVKRECVNWKLKVVGLAIVVLLAFSGCAVPFQTAETLEKGESEGIFGYTPLTNLSIIGNWGLTGYTDIGFGLDLNIPFFLHSLGFVSGKQKLLSLNLPNNNSLNLLVSGSTGILLAEDECPNYYQGNCKVGIKGSKTLFAIGGGILKDPRYTYDLWNNSFSEEVFKHLFIGLKNNHLIIQMHFVSRGEYGDDIVNFGIAYCK